MFGLAKILSIAHISSSKNRSMTFSYVVGVMLLEERLLSEVDNGRHKPIRAKPNGIPFRTCTASSSVTFRKSVTGDLKAF